MNISGKLVMFYYVISDGCVQTAFCVNMIIPEIGNCATFPNSSSCTCHYLIMRINCFNTPGSQIFAKVKIYRENLKNRIEYLLIIYTYIHDLPDLRLLLCLVDLETRDMSVIRDLGRPCFVDNLGRVLGVLMS